jgi:hypothetical protein
MSKLFTINSCGECPKMTREHTPGTGFGEDWWCAHEHVEIKKIAGYLEWPSEEKRVKIPKWCPLPDMETK